MCTEYSYSLGSMYDVFCRVFHPEVATASPAARLQISTRQEQTWGTVGCNTKGLTNVGCTTVGCTTVGCTIVMFTTLGCTTVRWSTVRCTTSMGDL